MLNPKLLALFLFNFRFNESECITDGVASSTLCEVSRDKVKPWRIKDTSVIGRPIRPSVMSSDSMNLKTLQMVCILVHSVKSQVTKLNYGESRPHLS